MMNVRTGFNSVSLAPGRVRSLDYWSSVDAVYLDDFPPAYVGNVSVTGHDFKNHWRVSHSEDSNSGSGTDSHWRSRDMKGDATPGPVGWVGML